MLQFRLSAFAPFWDKVLVFLSGRLHWLNTGCFYAAQYHWSFPYFSVTAATYDVYGVEVFSIYVTSMYLFRGREEGVTIFLGFVGWFLGIYHTSSQFVVDAERRCQNRLQPPVCDDHRPDLPPAHNHRKR